MKKNVLLFAAVMFMGFSHLSAQKAMIKFAEKEFDFGKISENGGNVNHVFEFTNVGNAALVVQRAQASCGCTTPEWTKTPIEPGKKGTLEVTYSPLGRPGPFTKQVTVYSNATNETEVIYIKGEVVTFNKQTEANNYPLSMDALGLKSAIAQMNNVVKGKSETRSIAVKNNGSSPLSISFANVPSYLTINAPATLKAGEENKFDITFNSQKTNTWGPINDDIYVVLNNNKVLKNQYKLSIISNVVEDFSKMTREEKTNSPIMEIKSPNIFFGDITQGHKVRGKIAIRNNGSGNLIIRRVVNNNTEIHVYPATLVIRGGKSGDLKVDIDTKNLQKGEYRRIINVQTNDPQNTYSTLNLSWNVK